MSYLLATEQVKAMQAKGLSAAMKHFALNDQETNRNGVCIFSNEQAIREIYLKAFEGGFTKGGATSTMTSYSRVGLTYVGHNAELLRNVLRGEWGFTGATISDCAMHPYQHTLDGLVGAPTSGASWVKNSAPPSWKNTSRPTTTAICTACCGNPSTASTTCWPTAR